MTPVDLLLAKLPDAKPTAKGWSACCPAHKDRRPSLSIAEGDDGRALVKCHKGCPVEAICAALSLRVADLMPDHGRAATNSRPTGKSFATADQTIAACDLLMAKERGERVAQWAYQDGSGQAVGIIVRYDLPTPDGDRQRKSFRPVSRHGGGWRIGGMPEPRPLYGLPDLAGEKRVYVCEGEKAADAARSIGLPATTSAHGAKSAGKTDWQPLAGKEIVILPDNDLSGRGYADTVAELLAALKSAPEVRILDLAQHAPNLPEGGDLADILGGPDWCGMPLGDSAERDDLRRAIEKLAEASPVWTPSAHRWPEIVSFDVLELPEFPTHVLPPALRGWVEAESHFTQTPPGLPALLGMAVCSATVARRVEVEARPGWREPVNLYLAAVLDPANRKSAVFTDATKPLRELETELIEAARSDVARAQSDRRQAEAQLRKLEKLAAEKGDAEARREAGNLAAELAEDAEQVLPRLIVDDATSEKLGMMLAEQDGRIASMSPEGGVFDLMAGRYSKSGMAEFDVYLKGHCGDDLITDRVSRKSVRVPKPTITCGFAIQPQVIRGLAEHPAFRGRGLLARFLYAFPHSWIGRRLIAPAPVPTAIRLAYHKMVRALATSGGESVLQLAADASALFEEWEAEIETMLGDGGEMEMMRDWGGKLAGATLRLAAVLHCVACGTAGRIGRPTIAAAITIARYLIPHAEAVLGLMAANDDLSGPDARYLLRWIERHGRREFTKRDAQQDGKRRFPRADDIDPALTELTRRGYIRLRSAGVAGPGRPPSPIYEVNPAVVKSECAEKRSHNPQKTPGILANCNSENSESAFEQTETEHRVRVSI